MYWTIWEVKRFKKKVNPLRKEHNERKNCLLDSFVLAIDAHWANNDYFVDFKRSTNATAEKLDKYGIVITCVRPRFYSFCHHIEHFQQAKHTYATLLSYLCVCCVATGHCHAITHYAHWIWCKCCLPINFQLHLVWFNYICLYTTSLRARML